jgi:hypothetical protein
MRLSRLSNECWWKTGKPHAAIGLLLVTAFCGQCRQPPAGKSSQNEVPASTPNPSAADATTENPAPVGDAYDLMVRSDPLGLLRIAQERYARTVHDYVCTFSKQELIDGRLTAEQVTRVKFREKPLSVNMLWMKNAGQARRAIYVEGKWIGKNGERLSVVEPAGAIARVFVDDVMRPIDGPDAKTAARRRIDQFGFSSSLRLIIKYCDLSAKDNKLDLKYVGDGIVGERPTYVLERRSAYTGDQGVYPDRLLIVYLDKESLLPVCCTSYADEAKTKLLGRYVLTDVEFNVGLTEVDFARKGE